MKMNQSLTQYVDRAQVNRNVGQYVGTYIHRPNLDQAFMFKTNLG